ncbi:BTAD domain-containing putative transcriptional regulator [Nonomuraea sp. NPDC050394]|uniref:BTAD domain-containing putative transcriptional regulator n=1 Tax=Nonomuraea sp. NPDC050394 TaxID=3364363 RepID=UPI00378FBB69
MRVVLLGAVQAFDGDTAPVEIGGVRLRMLLARLALATGRPVPAEALIDDLWGEDAPAGAAGALQGLVSRLRKSLGEVAAVELVAGGYRVPVRAEDVDVHRFEELAAQGRRELVAGRAREAATLLGAALGLWRGPALADVLDAPFARNLATRLDGLRAAATEDRFDAEVRLGRHADVLADIETAAAAGPLSERLAELRVRALSASGRQSDALAAYEEIRARLADELGVDPSPELRETHLALLRGELGRPAVPQSGQAAPARLPATLTSFVGRERELARLAELLAAARLVTIVGPGGAGKTRLALEAAAVDRAHGQGRVWFVPLAGVDDRLPDAVLGALSGLNDGGRQQATPIDRLADLLDVGDALLVLDNCEHVVEAAATLAARLLDRLPQLRILTTTREPLAITGEVLCHLGPLELPPDDPELTVAAASGAVRLFVERAAGVRPGFTLDAGTAGDVVEICRRLDGMPLALELAAARMRSMGVDQIARRLDDRFRLLTSGSRAALPRQRTLLAVVEWSWELLDERERALARRLSTFPGGATLRALETICTDSPPSGSSPGSASGGVLPGGSASGGSSSGGLLPGGLLPGGSASGASSSGGLLPGGFSPGGSASGGLLPGGSLSGGDVVYVAGSLVEKSLVRQDGERYDMLETIRAYAAARQAESGEDLSGRFTAYYLALAEEQEPLLRRREQLAAIAVFDAEHDNLVHALRGVLTAGDTHAAARFVRALFWYWGIRGMSNQFETFLGEVLALDLPEATRAAFQVIRLASAKPSDELPQPDTDTDNAAVLAFHPTLPLLRISHLAGDVQAALDHPDPWVRASGHLAHDFLLTEQGDPHSGAASRRAALRGFEEIGDRWGLVMSNLSLGREHTLTGDHTQAITRFERALAIATELGTEEHLHDTWTALSLARMRTGDLDGARRNLKAARQQAQTLGHRRMENSLLAHIAATHRREGDHEQADQILDQMQPLLHRMLYPEAMERDLLAGARLSVRVAAGDAPAARALLPAAIHGVLSYGNAEGLAWAAEMVAGVLSLEDKPEPAAVALGTAFVIRGELHHHDPETRDLIDRLTKALGENGYRTAFTRGATLPRRDALSWLTNLANQPPPQP